MLALEQSISKLGMLPQKFNLTSGLPIDGRQSPLRKTPTLMMRLETLSAGAASDSGHEYLLKLYLLTAKSDETSLDLCAP